MSAGPEIDVASWIGRRSEREDVISDRLIAEFTVTLSPYLAATATVPPGIFWCLAPDLVDMLQLGGDGHPRLGLCLPELPRRMWAGGELVFHGHFQPGEAPPRALTQVSGVVPLVKFRCW